MPAEIETPKKRRLVVARRVPAAVAERAARDYDALIADHDLDVEEAIAAVIAHRADAILIGHKVGLTAAHMWRLPDHLKIIANPSAGFDHMDVAACKARGIVVTNAPDGLTECTADLAVLLILAACRRAGPNAEVMRTGWRRSFGMPDNLGKRVSGSILGIAGMGRIGRAVARRARGFGMTIHYTDIARLPAEVEEGAEFHASLAEMLPNVDILSLHMPGGNGTVMTAEMFALMRPGSVFVNAARGSLVDEDALIAALSSGHLSGAGLDVYRNEPDFDLRLRDMPNIFLTPHTASATVETRDRMGFDALDNIDAVLAGRPALNPI
ncbi:D-glycerate dehydrogenase [Siculibacillus lacustris]|uniref:D-glycerate dehydrogenase n=1 Tax=Siculibacillus lacustris TaxID=1549641 RepID=A0A4Q9VRC7_9HYPH|nr:D-glycerate dehydrogenase [Siculibacillus lacustris]TBW38451.1 D-glycerate dehydrogenase [Siculibacillus lacustris]